MRLALVNQFYLPDLSPTAHLAASVAAHRAALGDQVTVLTGRGRYADSPAEGWNIAAAGGSPNLAVRRLWTPSLGKDSLARRLLDYGVFFLQAAFFVMALPGQHVMILMTTPPYVALIGVLHRFLHPKCRLILWNMDCYPETAERAGVIQPGGVVSRVLRGLNRWIYRRLDSVVCLDEAMRDLVAPAYAAEGRPAVHVVPNWEPEALFPRGATPAAWEPGTFFGGRAVVLYLGNAGSGHRFETVLDAAHTIGAEAAVFLFVGGGSAWGPLQEEVERRGLQNVVLRGYVAKGDTPSVLACGTAALITLKDSMSGVMSPSKLHASLAMGLPILYIGPPGGNVHEAIQKHGCGVSLRHGDVPAVVDFLTRLRQDERYESDLRARARAAFEADYNDRVALPRLDLLIDRGSTAGSAADQQRA